MNLTSFGQARRALQVIGHHAPTHANGDALAARRRGIERGSCRRRDPDEDDGSARMDRGDGGVDRVVGARDIERDVDAPPACGIQELAPLLAPVRPSGQRGAELGRRRHPVGQQVRGHDRAGPGRTENLD